MVFNQLDVTMTSLYRNLDVDQMTLSKDSYSDLPIFEHIGQIRKFQKQLRQRNSHRSDSRYPSLVVANKGLGKFSLHGSAESTVKIKSKQPQTYFKKNDIRPTFRPFAEEVIKFRPYYFTNEWMDKDLVNHRKEITHYVNFIASTGHETNLAKISCILAINDQIWELNRVINYSNLPPSTARVQWRQSFMSKQPCLILVYILLNRFGKVIALIRVGPNKAICVFESLSGVERAINNVGDSQGKRLLIITWWYPYLQNRSERLKIQEDKNLATNWLIQQQRGAARLDPLDISSTNAALKMSPSTGYLNRRDRKGTGLSLHLGQDRKPWLRKKSLSSTVLSTGHHLATDYI
ncbi:uncharacterized protein LOC106066114 isoform X1 [Biomphalaria glabrata]|uniref:Uncharacterized protein LOC106066114 isoform X1 n=2 Tax=Biomphalaria glabrata TaxID=6526 RepID=A0A9W2YP05_BIOGL|nr:uncharacterized protein LOC106066114 isoform X1 [Biomphalaria glabrata]